MPPAPAANKMSTEEVIAAVEQMQPRQAELVTRRLLQMQANRRVRTISRREADLLNEVFREKRAGFSERFDQLSEKRDSHLLTDHEFQELLVLVDESEAFTARRLEALVELANLRQIMLPELMKQLGLKAPAVA